MEIYWILQFYSKASIPFHGFSDGNANPFPFTSLNGIFQDHSKSTNSIPMLWVCVCACVWYEDIDVFTVGVVCKGRTGWFVIVVLSFILLLYKISGWWFFFSSPCRAQTTPVLAAMVQPSQASSLILVPCFPTFTIGMLIWYFLQLTQVSGELPGHEILLWMDGKASLSSLKVLC